MWGVEDVKEKVTKDRILMSMIQKNFKKSHGKGHEQKNEWDHLTKAGTMKKPIQKITHIEVMQPSRRIKLGKDVGLNTNNYCE